MVIPKMIVTNQLIGVIQAKYPPKSREKSLIHERPSSFHSFDRCLIPSLGVAERAMSTYL